MQNFLSGHKVFNFSSLIIASILAVLAGCGSGTPSTTGITPTSGIVATVTANSLQLTKSPATVKSDNTTTTTITVTAIDAANAGVPNTTVTMSANTGFLSTGSVVTNSTGTATLTFSAGNNSANRIATITATAGSITTSTTVQIIGSTVTVNPTTATLPNDGTNPVPLLITAKDSAGNPVPNTAVTLTTGGSGTVTLTPPCTLLAPCMTDSSGNLNVVATGGSSVGSVTVTVAAVGATATSTLTVSPSASTFAIDQQTLNGTVIANNTLTAMNIGNTLDIRVNAPAAANVLFASSLGVWNGGSSVVTVPVSAGKATARLTTTKAGSDSIQVQDTANSGISDALTVTMTAASSTASSITLQASPSLVAKSTSSTAPGVSTLTALVKDANGFPVGGAPVSFSIPAPTAGGGETVSPVVVYSATSTGNGVALGEARTTFTAGSQPSGAGGVQIRASVVNSSPTVQTTTSINIGGTAGSVTFGQATVLTENSNLTAYILAMSVQVADSNGNPVPGVQVNLSVWPIAWSTGAGCVVDPDTMPASGVPGAGTFANEDSNENLILDSAEDGTRNFHFSAASAVGGTKDSLITPPNSASGTLPGTVTTDATGLATFNLTYTKTNAIWIINRIRARTTVQGTEAVGETSFRLAALKKDADPDCFLPPSPYLF